MHVSQGARAAPPEVPVPGTAISRLSAFGTIRSGAARAPGAPASAPAHVLPPQPTPLLDREVERASVLGLLGRQDVHLLTLSGPGGVGKTHLALAIAERSCELFPGGIGFVDLTQCEDSSAARETIMATLPPRHGTEETLRAGSDYDERGEAPKQRILVVLDNCEHLLPGLAHEVAALLIARTDV